MDSGAGVPSFGLQYPPSEVEHPSSLRRVSPGSDGVLEEVTEQMRAWVAIAFAALDVPGRLANGDGELIVYPVVPSEPRILVGAGERLWRRLAADGPVADDDLSEEELEIIQEMAAVGLASDQLGHEARFRSVPHPWLLSPFHELVYALIASVAREQNLSCVFIKGPMLHAHGLRERAHSGDVDVWVDPSRFDDLLVAMEPWGWKRQPDLWAETVVNHSRTLQPINDWACEIDVHRRLPGIGVTDEAAYSVLVEASEHVEFAGVVTSVPNRSMSAVLSALHAMRPEIGSGTSAEGMSQAVAVLQLVGDEALTDVAGLGAQSALRAALLRTFPDRRSIFEHIPPARDWAWRQQPDRAHGYLVALRTIPFRQRLKMMWRILWPTRDLVQLSDTNAGEHSTSIFTARLRRLRRGTKKL